MDKAKLKELKELAEKATPGPWKAFLPNDWSSYCGVSDSLNGPICQIKQKRDSFGKTTKKERQKNNAAYIAAANPQSVLDLIAENERLEKMGDWLANKIEQLCGSMMCEACECVSNDCPDEKDAISWREVAYRAVAKDQ